MPKLYDETNQNYSKLMEKLVVAREAIKWVYDSPGLWEMAMSDVNGIQIACDIDMMSDTIVTMGRKRVHASREGEL